MVKSIVLYCVALACIAFPAAGQTPSGEIKSRVDAVVLKAYETASTQFPCKAKAGGKPKMVRWQDVAKCLNYAHERVDWEEVSRQLQTIRKEFGVQAGDILNMAESCLASHTLPFDKVFIVKDERALLPLSNSLLKFLPEGSLSDLPVFEKALKKQVGSFAGLYSFDKSGELSGSRSRLVLFQYADPKGNIHSAGERLLLDQFGVSWKDAKPQPGFRLPSDKISLK